MIARPPISRLRVSHLTRPCCVHNPHHIALAANAQPRTSPSKLFPTLQTRNFTPSRPSRDKNFKNHYEVLRMPPNSTKAELKKQFYALSKETHPDRHPDDPTAADRFSQISESYSILADDEKRRRYDRDFQRMQGGGGGRSGAGGNGGGSATYAGGRPASGLSKRRGTFRGPPPSFYAQGGYGSTSNGQSSQSQQQSPGQGQSQGQDPYMAGTFNSQAYTERPNTEFNSETTYRTQTVEDQRRMQRKAAEFRAMQSELDALADNDFWARFVIVSTVVALGVVVGTIIVNMGNTPRGGMTRADGSRRGEAKNTWAKG